MIGIYLCDDDRAVRRRIQEALERMAEVYPKYIK